MSIPAQLCIIFVLSLATTLVTEAVKFRRLRARSPLPDLEALDGTGGGE